MKPVIAELPIGSTTALKVRAQRRSQVSNSRRPASSRGSTPIRRSRRASRRGSRSQRFASARELAAALRGEVRIQQPRSPRGPWVALVGVFALAPVVDLDAGAVSLTGVAVGAAVGAADRHVDARADAGARHRGPG